MSKKRIKTAIVAAAIVLDLGACAVAPVHNVSDAPTTTPSGKPLEAGTLALRTHKAVVDIPYSATKYSIQLKSTENLNADDGNIHKNYNGWVQNLDRGIRKGLASL